MRARATILDPKLIVADEPVSMLDMSVRAKILELMLGLKSDLDLTYVYITHDLATAYYIADRIMIMRKGIVVEQGQTRAVLDNPTHPYSIALKNAVLPPDPAQASAIIRARETHMDLH